jgi:hypothetical protein
MSCEKYFYRFIHFSCQANHEFFGQFLQSSMNIEVYKFGSANSMRIQSLKCFACLATANIVIKVNYKVCSIENMQCLLHFILDE